MLTGKHVFTISSLKDKASTKLIHIGIHISIECLRTI